MPFPSSNCCSTWRSTDSGPWRVALGSGCAAVVGRERHWCHRMNGWLSRPAILALMGAVSWLGNGWFWYALVGTLAVAGGAAGRLAALEMTGVGLATLVAYQAIKRSVRRPRPCEALAGLRVAVAPLDRWSFPSGHTMHAVAFSLVAVDFAPALGWILLPFCGLVALSRVVLGLHYPTDVAAGTLLGAALAAVVLRLC